MTELRIVVSWDGITAMEIYCGDDVKYVETFPTWWALLEALEAYFPQYVGVEVYRELPYLPTRLGDK